MHKKFGLLLKKLVLEKSPREKIGSWAFWCYSNNMGNTLNNNFSEMLLDLSVMELGEEFFFSYEELEKIADDLIAGKDVKL